MESIQENVDIPAENVKEVKIDYHKLLEEQLATGKFNNPLSGKRVRFIKSDKPKTPAAKYVVDETALKPKEQLELSADDLEESVSRALVIDEYGGDQTNKIFFSYKDRKFMQKKLEMPAFIHFDIKGNSMFKDSMEARMWEDEQKEISKLKCRATKSNISYMDEYIDTDGEVKYRLLKNKFNFSERSSQTSTFLKDMETNTIIIEKKNFSDQVTQDYIYEIYEEDYKRQEEIMLKNNKIARFQALKKQNELKAVRRADLAFEERLVNSAATLECMVLQNIDDDVVHDFKYYEDPSDEGKQTGSILPLWKFTNELIKKKCVTAICWHPTHFSLFAIAIGSYDINVVSKGYIMLFSLKNPLFYQKKFNNDYGCMSLDWHKNHPHFLVAGFYRGAVQIFDFRTDSNRIDEFLFDEEQPIHQGPVWQVRWHTDTLEGHPVFYSLSADGQFIQWVLKKNKLFSTILLSLNQQDLNTRLHLLFPLNAGTCFDINLKPDDIYLVGTEEGKIYEYSTNYTSTLHTVFDAHAAPVYTVKWNPFFKKIFISCSSDWTVKIWDHRIKNAILTYDFGAPVADVDWSPYSSAVFAGITVDGKAFFYDLSISLYEPICEQEIFLSESLKKKSKLTKIQFNPSFPIILISDDKGNIYSFKLSPNLLSLKNERRPFKMHVIKKINYEIAKLSAIVKSIVVTTDSEKADTNRKYYDFVEHRKKTPEEELEEERNAAKKAALAMMKKAELD